MGIALLNFYDLPVAVLRYQSGIDQDASFNRPVGKGNFVQLLKIPVQNVQGAVPEVARIRVEAVGVFLVRAPFPSWKPGLFRVASVQLAAVDGVFELVVEESGRLVRNPAAVEHQLAAGNPYL